MTASNHALDATRLEDSAYTETLVSLGVARADAEKRVVMRRRERETVAADGFQPMGECDIVLAEEREGETDDRA